MTMNETLIEIYISSYTVKSIKMNASIYIEILSSDALFLSHFTLSRVTQHADTTLQPYIKNNYD